MRYSQKPDPMSAQEGSITCQNCRTTFEGKFCPTCSQKADTHRFTLKHFAHEFLHALTHTDKGILFLIKKLFTKPGVVAREYNSGMRKKYFNPITFLLITMALQIYVTKKTDFYNALFTSTEQFISNISKNTPDVNSSSQKALEEAKKQSPKILENSKIITFTFIPMLALITWLFFWKSGYNYAENLVFNIFLQGQANLYFLVVCILPFLFYPSSAFWVIYVHVVVVWTYTLIASIQFYQQRFWVTFFKVSVAQILYYVIGQQVSIILLDYLDYL
jgi:hypothetical protein